MLRTLEQCLQRDCAWSTTQTISVGNEAAPVRLHTAPVPPIALLLTSRQGFAELKFHIEPESGVREFSSRSLLSTHFRQCNGCNHGPGEERRSIMFPLIQFLNRSRSLRRSGIRAHPHRFLSIPLILGLTPFQFSSNLQASCDEGCKDVNDYSTYLGESALLLNGGTNNTAIGAL